MNPIKQAELPLRAETNLRLAMTDGVSVGLQNIALARIDVQPQGKPRRVLLNLLGVRDIDRLIEALQAVKDKIESEERYLDQYLIDHPEARIDAEEAVS